MAGTKSRDAAVAPPKFLDDLTRLPGVDANLAAELNKEGIHNFKQLESFSPDQKLAFEKRFGLSFDKLNVEQFAAGSAVGVEQSDSGSSASTSSKVIGGFGALGAAAGVAGFASNSRTKDSGHSNGSMTTDGQLSSNFSGSDQSKAATDPQSAADPQSDAVHKAMPIHKAMSIARLVLFTKPNHPTPMI